MIAGSESYSKDFADFFALFKGPVGLEIRELHVEVSGYLAGHPRPYLGPNGFSVRQIGFGPETVATWAWQNWYLCISIHGGTGEEKVRVADDKTINGLNANNRLFSALRWHASHGRFRFRGGNANG